MLLLGQVDGAHASLPDLADELVRSDARADFVRESPVGERIRPGRRPLLRWGAILRQGLRDAARPIISRCGLAVRRPYRRFDGMGCPRAFGRNRGSFQETSRLVMGLKQRLDSLPQLWRLGADSVQVGF